MATQNKLQRLEVTVGNGSKVVDLTEEETLQRESFVAQWLKTEAQLESETLKKVSARESGLAKLAALGLTEEEIAAL